MAIYSALINKKNKGIKSFAVLIDPDKTNKNDCKSLVELCKDTPPDFFMVGGSLITENRLEAIVGVLKASTAIPVVLFPGNFSHISHSADGLLLLSLVSGRNPEYLIGQHVQAVPHLIDSPLEVISTAYMLVDCGRPTTVSYISNTTPLPYHKPDIALCTALAGEMIGMKAVYMDGGSGAERPIAPDMIKKVAGRLKIPLIVGGGIRDVSSAEAAYSAGADLLVVGTAVEENPSFIAELYALRQNINLQKSI